MEVTDNLIEEFKQRMHISHSIEDDSLENMLHQSLNYVKRVCGDFDIDGDKSSDIAAKELALERTRYSYNEALEYFEDNFLSEILTLGVQMSDGYAEE